MRGRDKIRSAVEHTASLRRDREWVVKAREVAFELVDSDPGLARHPGLLEEVRLLLGESEAEFLLKS